SKFARGAANAFGGEEFLAWVEQAEVDGVKVGNHPFFLKTFAQIGRRMGEDGSHFSPSAEEKASLREKIKTKREELNKAKASQDHSAVERIDKELRELYEKAYPGSR